MITHPYARMLHMVMESIRRSGTGSARQAVVHEVKEADGERKMRCILGIRPDGTPWLSPWVPTQEGRSPNARHQGLVEKGMNGILNLPGDFRQATFTPGAEAKHAPQPKHASQINGDVSSYGKKMRVSYNVPQQDDQQQQQQSGGSQSSAQQQDQQKKGGKHHFWESWIAEEEEKLPQYKQQTGKAQSSTGSQSSFAATEEPQQQKKQEKEEKAAMKIRMHEESGHTALVGSGDNAVRMAAHPKGAKLRAGSENYFVVEKDKDAYVYAKANIWVRGQSNNYVSAPWVIKQGKKDPIPNDNG
jgi:hypothetical protein